MTKPLLHIIAVAYKRFGELKVFIQSWINQTSKNWVLTVIHDGKDQEFDNIMKEYSQLNPDQIFFFSTCKRYNDYGHTLRDIGIQKSYGEYILLTNADNYFIPKTVSYVEELLIDCLNKPDIIIFDMVHSHANPGNFRKPSYSYFSVEFEPLKIDISAALVKTELAKAVGFRNKTFNGDQYYFSDISSYVKSQSDHINVEKIHSVLLVHN